jgi:hypothetical protein
MQANSTSINTSRSDLEDQRMSKLEEATRRSFLKNGMLLGMPIAAASIVGAAQTPRTAAPDGLQARLVRLEDEAALRELHRGWMRQMGTDASAALSDPSARRMVPDPTGAPDQFALAGDGLKAVGGFDCLVHFETPLALDSTLARMAHAQGSGFVTHTERYRITVEYTKTSGTWAVGAVSLTG